MTTIDGISGAWNYTIGPIHVWKGLESLTPINTGEKPVVVVAKYIPLPELGRIEFTRVLGFVIEEGGAGDPSLMIFSNQHRATVLQAAGALAAAQEGATVVIDGVNAKVFFDPDEETLAKYEELRKTGPPPEPPGMVQKLMKVATDFKNLDPNALKGEIFDFQALGGVMDGVMAIWRKEALTREQRSELEKFAKGKPVEKSIHKNLERYDKWIAANPPEAPAGDEKKEGRGAKAGRAEEAKEKAEDAREARRRETRGEREGRAAEAEAGTATAKRPEAGHPPGKAEPAPAAAGGDAATEPSKESPKDAAAARRAAREAEIEAARKSRRGEDKKQG